MNGWYMAALSVAGLGFVFLIVCIIAAIFGLKNVMSQLLNTVNRLKVEQVEPLLTETTQLNTKIATLKQDIDYKKEEINYVVQAVKGVNNELQQLQDQTKYEASALIKKAQDDPARQAETERWTNTAMGFLNKK